MWIKTSLDYGSFEYDSKINIYFPKGGTFRKQSKIFALEKSAWKPSLNYEKISFVSDQTKFLIRYASGFFHVVMDFFGYIVNAVNICQELNIKDPLFIFADAPEKDTNFRIFLEKWLEDLNIKNYIILTQKDKMIEANNCFYLGDYIWPAIPNPSNSLHESFKNFYVNNKNIKPFKKTYLSRRKAERNIDEKNTYEENNIKINLNSKKSRPATMIRIFEEEKIENFLIDHGFEIVHPDEVFKNDFFSQINYFYEVKTLMSVTSSGLVNQILMQPSTNILEISTSHFFPKKMVEKSVAISELKPIDNITFSGEEHLQNFYKGFSHVKDQFYCAITNEDLQAETLINKIKNNKYLMDIIND